MRRQQKNHVYFGKEKTLQSINNWTIEKKGNYLETKNNDVINKIKECQKESKGDKKIAKETTNSLKQFNKKSKRFN